MKDFTHQYIAESIKTSTALYDAYKVLDENDNLKYKIESRLEQVLIELVDLITNDTNEKEMNKHRTHLKLYGIYSYDENGKENTLIVEKIIKNAKKQLIR